MAAMIPGFEETAEDLAMQPTAGCCADCDEALDIAAWEAEVTR